ncbi:ABC transporter substrate-binding protein [Paracidovorax citrulli]|uniref:Carbohydrate ABC transporter substrate-binding protein, CUT1 family n=2 Tax=Paracidovorax citrulli TaxID=80869 RepID=A1TPH3_PARC0|nr:ABC transporter substrate-binding protein [Paracidovorax citrulli]ABM32861.1 carbohydrate ABC transporter substrate-binding protein, CUT1 family [Paracidovorax citrulli AAC00-1]ATG93158.1 carbohydrate ABC transporter substrate-binding protein [Paracidovorax citrulli]MVT36829.1 extracellular solute-binding protein [Paracidovorax citrulli]PVY67078.1 carbohydrate ABC transporter substrate-binding protein (CUT1 family) [Paracidovorax citrulli]REG68759.1 carbohydrate ABC transporter substrate-bi
MHSATGCGTAAHFRAGRLPARVAGWLAGLLLAAWAAAAAGASPIKPREAARPAPRAAEPTALHIWHCWASPGEHQRSEVLARHLARHGLHWTIEEPVCGNGNSALSVFTQRFQHRLPRPAAVMTAGEGAPPLAAKGLLLPLDAIAREQEWEEVVPYALQDWARFRVHWIAAPLFVHSTNLLWFNKPLLDRLGGTVPDTWDELLELLGRAQAAGIVPVGIGADAWEYSFWFESVAAGAGGAEFYRRFFLEHDRRAYDEAIVRRIFARMAQLRPYLRANAASRDWSSASDMVEEGKALLQMQGSWLNGELRQRGMEAGQDYLCPRFPDTQGMVLYIGDQVGFVRGAQVDPAAQRVFMRMVMDTDFQREMGIASGAAPARVDVPDTGADLCGRQAIRDLRSANMRRTVLAAFSALSPRSVQQHINDIVMQHLQGRIDDARATQRLKDLILGTGPVGPER